MTTADNYRMFAVVAVMLAVTLGLVAVGNRLIEEIATLERDLET